MVHLYRIALALVLALLSGAASAYPASTTSGQAYRVAGINGNVILAGPYSTAGAAYGAALGYFQSITSGATVGSLGENYQYSGCTSYSVNGSAMVAYNGCAQLANFDNIPSCPAGGTLSGSTCTCPAGQTDNGSSCTTADPAAVCSSLNNGAKKLSYPESNTSTSRTSIYQGVTVTGKSIVYGKKDGAVVPGSQVVYGPFTCKNGSTVTADVPAGGDTPTGPASCKSTQYYGTVNNIPTCVDGSTTQTTTGDKTATAPTGSASAPASPLGGNAPPSATSEGKETTCEGSTCTTTTTYKDAAGNPVGTSSETKDQPSFCEENPALSICKDSRFSSGSCAAAPACDGDAVQCGIAKLAWQTACALNPTSGAESALYESSKVLTGDQTSGAAGSPVSISSASFSTSDLIGGGSGGMSDLNITVWNTSITLPLSDLNQYLAMFGNVLLGVAFIVAVSIIRGR